MPGRNLLIALVALIALAAVAFATTQTRFGADDMSTASALSEGQRDDVRTVVRNYLIENPGVIVEAIETMQARQHAVEQGRAKQALATQRSALENGDGDPVLGPDNASVTLVEFFDYQCPYCKKMTGAMLSLLEEDRDLRIVFKEFPILGDASVIASRAALAAAMQGKYIEFHVALMKQRGKISVNSIASVAGNVGLDVAQLRKDMDSDAVSKIVQANYKLAQAIGVTGTPAFIVGDQIVPGAVDIARLREMINDARAAKGS